jgi:hypothetical protein
MEEREKASERAEGPEGWKVYVTSFFGLTAGKETNPDMNYLTLTSQR